MWRLISVSALLCSASLSFAQDIPSPTLNSVRDRGAVVCGVENERDGFAKANSLGEYSGFSIDLCRAISAAVFSDAERTEFLSSETRSNGSGNNSNNADNSADNNANNNANNSDVNSRSTQAGFINLRDRRVDTLIQNTTWTASRDASNGDFAGIHYFDGQGFMVWKQAQVRNALELDNISLCVQVDTDAEANAANYFAVNNLRYAPVPFDTADEANEAYSSGLCDAITNHQTTLAALRSKQKDPNAHRLLGVVISKEPLAALVRANDTGWANVVRWSLFCMINAEELGITKENVRSINETDSVNVQRLAGLTGDSGARLGLRPTWCSDIIRTVGNYGETYERHLGENTAMGLTRGFNKLWIDGGLIFAPPIR